MWRVHLAVVLFLVAVSAVAQAGFNEAQWGMTPEQVAAAMPEAKLGTGNSSERLGGKTIGNTGEFEEGKRRYRATFYYDQRGLTHIAFKVNVKECEAVMRELIGAHGHPYRISDQLFFKLFIWHDPPQNNRLRLMTSPRAGVCVLNYERLDDYKAGDDEQAAKGK